jgi:hypothetical protein
MDKMIDPIIKCQRCGCNIPIDKYLCGRCNLRLECMKHPWKICKQVLWLCESCEAFHNAYLQGALAGIEVAVENLKRRN